MMQSEMVGVIVTAVKQIPDERGCVKKLHFVFDEIQDVYVTTVEQGAVKGWHGYKTKALGFTCIKGKVKLVVWNNNIGQFEAHFIGDENPVTVWVSPGIYTAFKGIAGENILLIVADEPYDEKGVHRLPPHDNYDWDRQDG
jgi:dTDP-4-dehydrorhamnose 3,5-epimerase